MQLYNYDEEGVFTVETEARIDAKATELVGEAQYIIPARAALVPPPDAENGKVRVFSNGAWSQVPDHRGETWWDGEGQPVIIEALGDPAGSGLTNIEPVEPEPGPPTKDDLVAYANAAQWAKATGGYDVLVNGATKTIKTTLESMALMNGKALRLQMPSPPATVNWQIGPKEFVEFPAAEFSVIATEIADFVQATFDALPAVISDIDAGTVTTTAQIDEALT